MPDIIGYTQSSNRQVSWITPDWPAPFGIKAASTLRAGGCSVRQFVGLNLAKHVSDSVRAVESNRRMLHRALNLPGDPVWLQQVHSTTIVSAETVTGKAIVADGSYTRKAGVVCTIMTADCLPVLLCDQETNSIAAVHAGWRGLLAGILETAVQTLAAKHLIAWLGPGIGPDHYEVGNEVRDQFLSKSTRFTAFFKPSLSGKWYADMPGMAESTLNDIGGIKVYRSPLCTFSNPELFYSYRRDNMTGRMATLIWREEAEQSATQI